MCWLFAQTAPETLFTVVQLLFKTEHCDDFLALQSWDRTHVFTSVWNSVRVYNNQIMSNIAEMLMYPAISPSVI